MRNKPKLAFTLAEVLITLAIVGVIASLTIPALISNVGNKQEVTQLKKAYATLSQAFVLVQNDNGGVESAFASTMDDGSQSLNYFAAKLNVIKNCGSGAGCWYKTALKYYNGSVGPPDFEASVASYGRLMLADGSMIMLESYQSGCTSSLGTGPLLNSICGNIIVDVNGAQGPNIIGKDWFRFWITKTGLQPYGSNADGQTCGAGTNWVTSTGCTIKVLFGQ